MTFASATNEVSLGSTAPQRPQQRAVQERFTMPKQEKKVVVTKTETNVWRSVGDGASAMFDGKTVFLKFDITNDYGLSKDGKGKMTKLAGSKWVKDMPGNVQGTFWFGIDKTAPVVTPEESDVAKLLGNLDAKQLAALKKALAK